MNIKEKFGAFINTSKFSAFLKGVDVELRDGTRLCIRIKSSTRMTHGVGLRVSRYSYRTDIEGDGIIETGYGDDDSSLLAFQKSVAEGIERLVYRITLRRHLDLYTTNGWACHLTSAKAEQAALEELAERDAVLVHWLRKIPMLEIDHATLPQFLKDWQDRELSQHLSLRKVRVLLTHEGFAPAVVIILQDEKGYSVTASATGKTLEGAVIKGLNEACRLGSNLEKRYYFLSSRALRDVEGAVVSPPDHGLLYAYHEKLPQWIFGDKKSWKQVSGKWEEEYRHFRERNFHFEFHQIMSAPLVVGYGISRDMQRLFFGKTRVVESLGYINHKRLNLKAGEEIPNLLPHFIA